MTQYVCGFLFNIGATKVALIRKRRPAWQCGLFNGLGGKVELGEKPIDAMAREFHEESGVTIRSWELTTVLSGPNYEVRFYSAFSELIWNITSCTDELVAAVPLSRIHDVPTIPNLPMLIEIARLRDDNIIHPVMLRGRAT